MIIIGITGTNGAGKGTVVEYLVSLKGFKHFSVGDFLINELEKQNRKVDRDDMREIANEIRTEKGPDYITKELLSQAEKSGQNAVIESIRNPKEAEYIINHGGVLFAVDADQKIRYRRITSRGSVKDNVSFKDFILQEEKEKKSADPNSQNLTKCILMADKKFDNNGSINNLYEKVEKAIKDIE